MAPDSHGRAGHYGSLNIGNGAADMMPPPSTLAAQLVENISTAAKSSRPDESQELKRLISGIERVKNRPDLLKTPEEHVEHNHMLIYVYSRVALDNVKWDDLFADRAALTAGAVKAVSFLKVTIKETPDVLDYTTDGSEFLFRGQEPLWLWILPKLLRLAGHPNYASLAPSISEFCEFILLISSQLTDPSRRVGLLIRYFQGIVDGIVDRIHGTQMVPLGRDGPISLILPSQPFFGDLFPPHSSVSFQGHTFQVPMLSQAVQLARGILSALTNTITNTKSTILAAPTIEYVPWLLDSLFSIQEAQRRWDVPLNGRTSSIIQCAVSLCSAYNGCSRTETTTRTKILNLLVLLCGKALELPEGLLAPDDGISCRRDFCLAVIEIVVSAIKDRPVLRLATSKLLKPMEKLVTEHAVFGDGTDFDRCLQLLKAVVTSAPSTSGEAIPAGIKFQDEVLQLKIESLNLSTVPKDQSHHAPKRVKLSAGPVIYDIIGRLSEMLGPQEQTHGALFHVGWEKLMDRERCESIDLLAYLACASDDTLTASGSVANGAYDMTCSFCVSRGHNRRPSCQDIENKAKATAAFKGLVRNPTFLESRRPRVVAMIALRRLVLHSVDPEFLDFETSAAGQWCLQSLQSSVRELRIAAGRTLTAFLGATFGKNVPDDIAKRNKANALAILKELSEKDIPRLHETCIMAWGQVGRVAPDDELDLVLSKLMDFLGHRSQILSAFAVNEILNLASTQQRSPRRLFGPYWKNLAFSAVKDLVARPQTAQIIADLLQLSMTDLVYLLERHALPWLVLTKRREVIQKFAELCGEKEVWRPCVRGVNLGCILALLLAQDVPRTQIENFTMSLLRHVSPHFNESSLADLLRAETVETVLELLKAAGDADEKKKRQIHISFEVVASLLPPEGRGPKHKKDAVSYFLQQHVLGITACLAEVVNDDVARHPSVQEQRRCIRAMEEMIKLCGLDIRRARPQISAFLLTALAYDELRAASFTCWVTMLHHFNDALEMEYLLDITFFIIGNHWPVFDAQTRREAKEVLVHLQGEQSNAAGVIVELIDELPSLGHIQELKDVLQPLESYRTTLDNSRAISIFANRLRHENSGVVLQALSELAAYLRREQGYLQTSALSDQPDPNVALLARALLDCSAKYNGIHLKIASLCVECIGLVGCIDSNRLETVREQRQFVVLQNFEDATETTDFVLFLLEEVLVKAFLSAADPSFQGFLSYTMQELLVRCDFKAAVIVQDEKARDLHDKWLELPEHVREVLTPFMTSRYRIQPMAQPVLEYPVFRAGRNYAVWLRSIVVDLLEKGQNTFAEVIFEPLSRVIKVNDLAVAEFLLPYLFVHVIVGDRTSDEDRLSLPLELRNILSHEVDDEAPQSEQENMKLYCEAVFRVLDYCMRWLQKRRSQPGLKKDQVPMTRVQVVLDSIPATLISQRAVKCRQFARALFHLEPHVEREWPTMDTTTQESQKALRELQAIYSQIDEPDSLDGFSSRMKTMNLKQQMLSHKKAGRWAAVQTWLEMGLAVQPDVMDIKVDLLHCLRESGQQDALLNHVENMLANPATINKIVPFAVEASWTTSRWDRVHGYMEMYTADRADSWNLCIASALLSLKEGDARNFAHFMTLSREKLASSMSYTATSSLHACHDVMMKAHLLVDLEIISGCQGRKTEEQQEAFAMLSRRLEVMGAYVSDKQYVLGVRRAAMAAARWVSPQAFAKEDISSSWLLSARLARKAGSTQHSFNCVLHANQMGDQSATIDNARLLWKEGQQRNAIQVLQSAIADRSFITPSIGSVVPTASKGPDAAQNLLAARAHLLLAKWLDAAGHTHAGALRVQYQLAAKTHPQWEKGHYYLGRHYKKVLESEKFLKRDDQSDEYLSGETAKLVIENYLRSLNYGTKYLYQTLPRILTLWLELGSQVNQSPEGKVSVSRELLQRRKAQLQELHKILVKNMQRIPAYIFYTALPQVVARIAHPNADVFRVLEQIILKVVEAHPRQALWGLFGIMTSKHTTERKARGLHVLQALKGIHRKVENGSYDLRQLLRMGEKLAGELLSACNNGDFQSNRTTLASITRDLNFSHNCTPCPLVVPVEGCLTATLPTLTDNVKKHKAFTGGVVTIDSFQDDVLVLGSLAKPRKLTARGSNGQTYGLLIKPKDDLRTDQRLMEFNGMINRSLKRDAESSRRQLYIRTYAVTPLNEECGIIEWVDGLKTLRDILLGLYKSRGITPNYTQLAQLMKEAQLSEDNIKIFTHTVLGTFPAVLPAWFVSQFANPSAWFAARLKYTRSCAVMSMVGTILGLGDRHGENVLLEEGNGGVFHVDFNCLFDKGLTFQQPERVPFRLTHNMVAAMGIYGHEGPFRRCSELTLTILRQQEETLMTILEAFIYDPTLDLQKLDKKKRQDLGRLNPQSVVDSIKRKVRGLLPDESIPLGVEGQVEELIKQAVNPRHLTAMYIGWCPFL